MVRRRLITIMKGERGIALIEIAISMLLFAIVGIFILYGVATASLSLALSDERETSKNLAESEIEYIKLTDYSVLPLSWSYDLPTSSPVWDITHVRPPGFDTYSILVQGNSVDIDGDGSNEDDMQMISVTVSNRDEIVLTLQDYVVNP
ncbi:hypothetical protein ACFLS8_00535 [Chloroflexota bacterium]